jgi:hypothetical protein
MMLRIGFHSALLAAACALPAAADDKVDYQKVAGDASWDWRPERADVLYSAMNAPKEYTIEVVRPKDKFGEPTIRFIRDDKTLYSLAGHAQTTFVIDGSVLYYADYSQYASGCALVAYDLKDQKQLWKTSLQGLGPIAHFRYRNEVAVEAVPDAILVRGKESAGKYIEYVDRKSGQTMGHKIFKDN